ncbi:hypothetical protein TNCV_4407091 [Trichonephila clavipes]|nr:hypothetical protein TNCV_4407091 [Trichonephila clavipes]
MFLAGHPSQGCFGLQSHCAPCYFFNQASSYPSDFSFKSDFCPVPNWKEQGASYFESTIVVIYVYNEGRIIVCVGTRILFGGYRDLHVINGGIGMVKDIETESLINCKTYAAATGDNFILMEDTVCRQITLIRALKN